MFKNKIWECLSLHIWLIMSSFGIMFAVLSFFKDIGICTTIFENYLWLKGVLSIIFGLIFYIFIGIPHLNGAKNRN